MPSTKMHFKFIPRYILLLNETKNNSLIEYGFPSLVNDELNAGSSIFFPIIGYVLFTEKNEEIFGFFK